jgi:hypothetical protein
VATVTLPCRDDDGDPIARAVVTGPAHGELGPVDQAAGTVVYTPDPGFTGPDSFSFQGSDASGSSAPARASLTVTAAEPTAPRAFGTDTLVTLTLARARIPARGPVAVRISNANDFPVSGRLSGRSAKRRRITLKGRRFEAAGNATRTVRLKLPKSLRRALQRRRKLALRITATLRDPAGNARTVRKTLRPRLRRTPGGGRITSADAMSADDARAVAKHVVTPIAKMADARATYRVRMQFPSRATVRARLRGRIDMNIRLSVEERPDVWRVNLESMRVL